MKIKNLPLIIICALIVILGLTLAILLQKRSSKPSISSNILSLTPPVTSFSGTVEKISGNTITLTQTVTEQLPAPIYDPNNLPTADNPASPLPSPATHILTYQVLVTDQTVISQPPAIINYLFKSNNPPTQLAPSSQPTLSIQDIKEGQYLSINTLSDLRTLSGDQFEATSINLPMLRNSLTGTIISITDNTLVIKAYLPPSMSPTTTPENPESLTPQQKEFTLTITSDTEISGMNSQGQPQRYSLSDLKQDQQISVYSAEDIVDSETLTALRIEPLITYAPANSNLAPTPITPESLPTPESSPTTE